METNHILVGLGGTGGKILKAIRKRLFSEFPNDEERNNLPIGFVYVDSTREMMNPGDPTFRVLGKDASFTESEFVNIKSVDLTSILENISGFPGLKNIVTNASVMKNAIGEVGAAAGQKRRAGRILFAANCNRYLSCLKAQYEKVHNISGLQDVQIHIFTGLAGGTGSGSIVDVIAQTRAQESFKDSVITVYAMVPELEIPKGCQAGRYHQNGYAALKELNALNLCRFLPSDVISGKNHVELDDMLGKQFGLVLYSNVNENGIVVNSLKELPNLVADTVFFNMFLQVEAGITDDYIRALTTENIPDYLIEYSEKTRGDDKERARTKAISTFGIKRIVYPERRILEHISYTVGLHVLYQMQYNNFKENFGYVKEPPARDFARDFITEKQLADWKLDYNHLKLEEHILESEEKVVSSFEEFWKGVVLQYTYKEAKSLDSNPFAFLERFCEDTYYDDFRYKVGVKEYFMDRRNDEILKEYTKEIIGTIEQNLYTMWYEGSISLYDLSKICECIIVDIKKKQDKIKKTINENLEIIKKYRGNLDVIIFDSKKIMSYDIFGKSKRLYSEYQLVLRYYYVLRTENESYSFSLSLLSKLKNAFEQLSNDVNDFIGVLTREMDEFEKRISDRTKTNNGISDLKATLVEVSEDTKIERLEREILLDRIKIESLSSVTRKEIAGNTTYAHFDELAQKINDSTISTVFDTSLSEKVRIEHDNRNENDRILGINVLQQLQKILVTDEDLKKFSRDIIQKSGVLLKLNDEQLGKALRNNLNPVANPESINRKVILVSMPKDDGNDSLKVFAGRLKNSFIEAFGNATAYCQIVFDDMSGRKNEITVVTVRYCYPMRAIEWLKSYEREYNDMINSSNTGNTEARILLHSEGDPTKLPELMGEKNLSEDDMLAYVFLAVANKIIEVKNDEVNGKGWCSVTKDLWDNEVLLFLSVNFTGIILSENLSEDIMSDIQEKIDDILSNPELKVSERTEMVEIVKSIMKNIIPAETSSTTSKKYQQYSKAAIKAIEMVNKK